MEFQSVSDLDLLKATLFNRSRLSENGCWIWFKNKDRGGYGMMSVGNKTCRAHRISYEAHIGPIPKDRILCHSCDTPSCINPHHLRVGTAKDNAVDRELRNRRDVRGTQVGTAKLTEVQVLEIKWSVLPLALLAKKYGVHKSNVSSIKNGKSWKHLTAYAAA